MSKFNNCGICGWGVYIPRFKIATREIARMWGDDPLRVKDVYLVDEKSVTNFDEDSITMAIEASRIALQRANINSKDVDVVFVGTESKPYAVKPIASILIDALGLRNNVYATDMEFACKASSDAMITIFSLINSGIARYGLAVGTDASQGEPGEHLDYTVGCGAAAFVLGRDNLVAYLEGLYTYSSDTPDFWRRDGSPYPVHGEGFTGEPAYFKHIVNAALGLMNELGLKPTDFDYVIFHQPNTRFPLRVASILKIPIEKVKPGIVVNKIGNTYNASALIGFAKILEEAKPNSRILLVTYGSGAGSNAFSFITTDLLPEKVKLGKTVEEYLQYSRLIDYALYVKFRNLIKLLKY